MTQGLIAWGARSSMRRTRGEKAHGRCLRGVPAPPRALHMLLRCATPEARSWTQGACGTPQAVKCGAVSGGQPGRDERRNVVEAQA